MRLHYHLQHISLQVLVLVVFFVIRLVRDCYELGLLVRDYCDPLLVRDYWDIASI